MPHHLVLQLSEQENGIKEWEKVRILYREREKKLQKFREDEGTEADYPICLIQNTLTPVSGDLLPRLCLCS